MKPFGSKKELPQGGRPLGCSSLFSDEKTQCEEARYQVHSKLTTCLLEKVLVGGKIGIHCKKEVGGFFGGRNWTRMFLATRKRNPASTGLKNKKMYYFTQLELQG